MRTFISVAHVMIYTMTRMVKQSYDAAFDVQMFDTMHILLKPIHVSI